MKIIKYLTAALIALIAWSCADEGPETIGTFEINHRVTNVKSRSARVVLTLPKSNIQIISSIEDCWLITPDGELVFANYGDRIDNETETEIILSNTFYKLEPSTTYTIMARVFGSFNNDPDNDYNQSSLEMELGTLTTLSDSEAFKTDYLIVSNNCVAFNLSLDHGLSSSSQIEHVLISDNPEMNNSKQLYVHFSESSRAMDYNVSPDAASVCSSDNDNSTVTITLHGLEPDTKYYYTVELRDGWYDYMTVTPGDNSFTTTQQPADILNSIKTSLSLEPINPDYDSNRYRFTCSFDFGSLNVREGFLFLNGVTNNNLHFYGNKYISEELYLYPGTLSYSLGLIVDFIKDGVTYTANGITYTPENNVIEIHAVE